MGVDITDEQDIPIDIEHLRSRLHAALAMTEEAESEVSILLTNDGKIAELNQQYRDIAEPTDVLSFSMTETQVLADISAEPEAVFASLLGDIVISVPTAQRQAVGSLQDEVETLGLHGLLHLLGHDHEVEGWEAWETALKGIMPHE
jgi:rRNA maturation RNase YbeY